MWIFSYFHFPCTLFSSQKAAVLDYYMILMKSSAWLFHCRFWIYLILCLVVKSHFLYTSNTKAKTSKIKNKGWLISISLSCSCTFFYPNFDKNQDHLIKLTCSIDVSFYVFSMPFFFLWSRASVDNIKYFYKTLGTHSIFQFWYFRLLEC